MGFFSGPDKSTVLTMAQGVANVATQNHMLDMADLDAATRQEVIRGMQEEGKPTSMHDLIRMAASVPISQNMGWVRKNQFLGAIHAYLVNMGMSYSQAEQLKKQIEVLS
jgi:hypothetical protein